MKTDMPDVEKVPSAEERVRWLLQDRGPLTIEQLAGLSKDLTWSQVFLAVDRLSRSGAARIERTQQRGYLVSLRGAVALAGPPATRLLASP